MDEQFYLQYAELENSHWWFKARRSIFARIMETKVLVNFKPHHDVRILDIGSGAGSNIKFLRQYGKVVGIDMSDTAVKFATGRGLDVRLASLSDRGSLVREGISESSYDIITMFDVLEHIENDAESLVTTSNILKPGGILFISVPAFSFLWGLQDEVSHHYRRYTKSELKKKVEGTGLQIIQLSYFNTFLFPLVAGYRLSRKLKEKLGISVRSNSSDFDLTYGVFDRLFENIFESESAFLKRFNLPFGVSLVMVASKQMASPL
jgi:2-polyprenyl-3-methyl-5-hydroxy-6-metoxy-1,4-benzoquinol methylase